MMVRQYTRGIERRESLPTRRATRYKAPGGRRMIGRSNRAVVVAALQCAMLACGLARPAEAPSGIGPRVEKPALMMINRSPCAAALEAVDLMKKCRWLERMGDGRVRL